MYVSDLGQKGTWLSSVKQIPCQNSEMAKAGSQKVISMSEFEQILANIEKFEKEILNLDNEGNEENSDVAKQIRRYRSENITLRRLIKAYTRRNKALKSELDNSTGEMKNRKMK